MTRLGLPAKYTVRREMRDEIFAAIKVDAENARNDIEQFFFAEHFEKGGETGPFIVLPMKIDASS